MVLPPPAADAGAAQAQRWLDRLIRPLELSRDGILLCLSDATPTQLGPVVRALSPSPPWSAADDVLAVCLRATQVLEVRPGSRVLLRVRTEDLDWLNIARPLFKERELRTVLWADAAAHEGLIRRAIDFHDWVSRTVAVPAKAVPDFAVERLRSALARGAEIGWHGPGLIEALDAVGVTERVELHVEEPFLHLRGALSRRALPIVAGVRTPQHVWRIRLALDEARPRGAAERRLWIALDPDASLLELEAHDARQADWNDASAKLAAAGWRHAALLAAWVDLDPAKLEFAVEHVGVEPLLRSVPAYIRDDGELRQQVAYEVEEEVGQTGALLESLIGDGDFELARILTNEWAKRATSTNDATTQSLVREWQSKISASAATVRPPQPITTTRDQDLELIERIRDGNKAAMSKFVEMHYDDLRRHITRVVPETDAPDVLQRCFERFLRMATQTELVATDMPLRTLLFQIARSEVSDYYHGRYKRSTLLTDDGLSLETLDDTATDNDDRLDGIDALHGLPPDERWPLLLRARGFSYAEIAAIMGVTEVTLRSRVFRTRRRLKRLLGHAS